VATERERLPAVLVAGNGIPARRDVARDQGKGSAGMNIRGKITNLVMLAVGVVFAVLAVKGFNNLNVPQSAGVISWNGVVDILLPFLVAVIFGWLALVHLEHSPTARLWNWPLPKPKPVADPAVTPDPNPVTSAEPGSVLVVASSKPAQPDSASRSEKDILVAALHESASRMGATGDFDGLRVIEKVKKIIVEELK
jgi:hypothetical protein